MTHGCELRGEKDKAGGRGGTGQRRIKGRKNRTTEVNSIINKI